MGTPKKKLSSSGPTRRKVLATALAAGAGVAGARLLGVRNLDIRAARTAPAMDAMTMAMGDYTGEPMEDLVQDLPDAFPFADYLDGSVPPAQLDNVASLPPVATRPAVAAPVAAPAAAVAKPPVALAAQPPITGIAIPKIATGTDWVSPMGSDFAKIAHLLRRTTFGATEAELDRAMSDGFAKTVDRLLETPIAEPPELTAPAPRQSATPSPRPSASATLAPALPIASTAPSATPMPAAMTNQTPIRINDLQAWWVDWMLKSPTPFAERMTLFWHGHFTSDYRKVGTNSPAIYWQNQTWRRMSLGDLKSMLLQVTPDLAMLRYLDLGASTGRNPNENYARELLELFTMGVGNYSEDDVKAAAQALAGWRLPMRTEPTARTGIFDPRRAYTGAPVTFLGRTASFDTAGVVDQILAHNATAPYIVKELVSTFVGPATDAYIARLADRFRRAGYDTKALLRDIFTSPEFVSPEAYRRLIKSATEFMVSAAKALNAPTLGRTIVQYGPALGQSLFDPPSVAGWGDGPSWISSNTMLQRSNFVTAALNSMRTVPSAARAHERHLDNTLAPGTVDELNASRDDRSRWFAVLASPEFHLK